MYESSAHFYNIFFVNTCEETFVLSKHMSCYPFRLEGTRVYVISFMPTRKVWHFLCRFSWNSQLLNTLCAYLYPEFHPYRTIPLTRGKYLETFV